MFEPGFPISLEVREIRDFDLLEYWLQRFILEIRRKDGQPYPGDILIQIASGIQRHLRLTCNYKNLNLFKSDDSTFSDFRKLLDARMKDFVSMGIGVKKAPSDPIANDDEVSFWSTGVFNMNTSEGLSNACFYYNGKAFGFRGYQEHMDCQADQYELLYDHENKAKYVVYTPGWGKMPREDFNIGK